jgi:hypothetical protein
MPSLITGENQLFEKLYLSRYLDTVGDGTGLFNANGNYAAGVTEFKIVPGAGEIFCLTRLLVTIEDTAPQFNPSNYGSIVGGLANGVNVKLKDGGGDKLDLIDGNPVQTNGEWGTYCYDVDFTNLAVGNQFLHVRWTFTRGNALLWLKNSRGDYFSVDLNDDLRGLISHYFVVQGFVYTTNA